MIARLEINLVFKPKTNQLIFITHLKPLVYPEVQSFVAKIPSFISQAYS